MLCGEAVRGIALIIPTRYQEVLLVLIFILRLASVLIICVWRKYKILYFVSGWVNVFELLQIVLVFANIPWWKIFSFKNNIISYLYQMCIFLKPFLVAIQGQIKKTLPDLYQE